MSLFTSQLKKYERLIEKQASKEVRKLALGGLTYVTEESRVDEGTFRGNWNVAINTIDNTVDESRRDNPIPRGNAQINKYDNGDEINISNNMPYAGKLDAEDAYIIGAEAVIKSLIRRRNKKV